TLFAPTELGSVGRRFLPYARANPLRPHRACLGGAGVFALHYARAKRLRPHRACLGGAGVFVLLRARQAPSPPPSWSRWGEGFCTTSTASPNPRSTGASPVGACARGRRRCSAETPAPPRPAPWARRHRTKMVR